MRILIWRARAGALLLLVEAALLGLYGHLDLAGVSRFFIAASFCWLSVFGMGYQSYRHNMLTATQFTTVWPGDDHEGVPNLWHGGMWADEFLLNPTIAYAVGVYGATWSVKQLAFFAALAVVVSLVRHRKMTKDTRYPDSLVWSGQGITRAGLVHIPYDIAALAVMGLYFFCSSPSPGALSAVTYAMGMLIILGTHTVLAFTKAILGTPWVPFEAPQLGELSIGTLSLVVIAAGNYLGAWAWLDNYMTALFV